jgi:acyl-CoA reductase-like NAD-dependent aldehyde dehydrogenase
MSVHEDVYEPLKEAFVAYARTVKVNDGAEQGIQLGPRSAVALSTKRRLRSTQPWGSPYHAMGTQE